MKSLALGIFISVVSSSSAGEFMMLPHQPFWALMRYGLMAEGATNEVRT